MLTPIFKYRLPLLLVTAAVILPLFFWGGPDGYSWPVLREFWNLGHFIFFALPGLIWQWWKGPAGWRAWLALTLVGLVLGAAIEVVQGFIGRDVDVRDVYHDLVGLWLGLAWGALNKHRWGLRLLTSALLLPSLYHLVFLAYAQYYQWSQLPLVNSFESRWDLVFARGEVNRDCTLASAGQCSLRVRVGEYLYQGGNLEIYGGDWRGHKQLAMDFYNPQQQPLAITVRINDLQHARGAHRNEYADRFNHAYVLSPGWSTLVVPMADLLVAPATRQMDLTEIYLVQFFTAAPVQPQFIYWDNLRLN